MSLPSASSSNGKLYQFISDPQHQETLSGRVRAACLTCRKKKTRCSGEIPCSTCISKGILCEGFAQRKRPRQHRDLRRLHGIAACHERTSNDSATGSRRRSIPFKSPEAVLEHDDMTDAGIQSPPTTLKKSRTTSSDESGYVSAPQEGDCGSTSSHCGHVYMDDARHSMSTSYISSCEGSPTMDEAKFWRSSDPSESSSTYSPGIATSQSATQPFTMCAPQPPHISNVASAHTSWPNSIVYSNDGGMDLVSAAMVLEEQAQTLRRLALEQDLVTPTDARQHLSQTAPSASPIQSTTTGLTQHYPQMTLEDMASLFPDQDLEDLISRDTSAKQGLNDFSWDADADNTLHASQWYVLRS